MMTVEEARQRIGAVVEYDPPKSRAWPYGPRNGVLRGVGPRVISVDFNGLDGQHLVDPQYLTLVPPSPWVANVRAAADRIHDVIAQIGACEAEDDTDGARVAWENLAILGFTNRVIAGNLADWFAVIVNGDGLGCTYAADEARAGELARLILGERS
jgi:hypothetical protein